MSRDSFLNRDKKKGHPSNRRAKKQEKELVKRIAFSGAGTEKGDVRVKNVFRIECKTTSKKSFSVTLEMIEKIEQAALSSGEMPILVLEFNDGKGNRLKEIAVCPTYVLGV